MEYHSGGSLPLLGRPRYCPGANANGGYLCETGHCCGETGCCTYYYELWWFWLLWTVLILFSCCCAYRHRRAKLRVQQQQRQREISLLAYHGASSYTSSMLDLSFLASLKLPSYEEVAAQPSTPPPPYSSVFTTPRYPQPPRAADPHLLMQHDPLLHRPLSDGPSSLSSDNSSSCSCDSCCPSSPCSSSLSAPVTYETDTSHATTPSEAPPLALDVTMETIAAAATCLEVNEMRLVSERTVATVAVDLGEEDAAGVQERVARDSSITLSAATRAASPRPLPSPSSEVALLVRELDLAPCTPVVSTGSPVSLPSPGVADAALPSVKIMSAEDPAEGPKITSISGPSTPTASHPLNLIRTVDTSVPSSPTSAPSPDVGRSLDMMSSNSLPTLNAKPCHVSNLTQAPEPVPSNVIEVPEPVPSNIIEVPEPVPSNIIEVPEPVPSNIIEVPEPVPSNLIEVPEPVPVNFCPFPDPLATNLTQTPERVLTDLTQTPDPVPSNLTLVPNLQPEIIIVLDSETDRDLKWQIPSPGSSLALVPPSLESGLLPLPGSVPAAVPALVPSESDHISPLPSNDLAGFSSGSGSCPLSSPSSSSCPAITIESECSPPPAPALLLDPLTALHQSSKDGSSSGHASSLSPSPRATQSPPKQTLFSPCVDVFEPGPPSWEDGEEDPEEDDQEEDDNEDEDMGADESQYRHRRLTGDSGIEVCRCRVGEEEEEEEEEEDVGERKEDGRRGGDKKGGGDGDLHDSVDCPARGQTETGDGLILCNATATAAPVSEDGSKVVVVMETV